MPANAEQQQPARRPRPHRLGKGRIALGLGGLTSFTTVMWLAFDHLGDGDANEKMALVAIISAVATAMDKILKVVMDASED